MAISAEEHLRMLLGERIPADGADADTMFSDEEIELFLVEGHGSVKAAAYHGWVAKAAELANLTNVIEGNSSREMAELHRQALRMIDRYSGYASTPSRGRARIGRIVRPGVNG
jgi:hypothetical protein